MGLRSPFMTPEREAFRRGFSRFVTSEIAPHIEEWERDRAVLKELAEKIAALGVFGHKGVGICRLGGDTYIWGCSVYARQSGRAGLARN